MKLNFQTKYTILSKLGEGSFSEVLKCENRSTGIRYAAKCLRKFYKTKESVQACAEIVAAEKVPPHPNILNILEHHYDSFSGRLVFIFDLMDMSMHDFLKSKRGNLDENKAKVFLHQLLRGLGHLHRFGLFHRDVKPENILLRMPNLVNSRFGHASVPIVKLADLGSVRGIFSEPPYTEYISTRWYRAPECLLTVGHYGPKMDVWASGCVFYEMLTLKPLFAGSNELDQLAKIHRVLGSPNIQLLSKLKTKSRNCVFFPKLRGIGFEPILPNVSAKCRSILRLMMDYDPGKRINVRRLLKNNYFENLRQPSSKSLSEFNTRTGSFKDVGKSKSTSNERRSLATAVKTPVINLTRKSPGMDDRLKLLANKAKPVKPIVSKPSPKPNYLNSPNMKLLTKAISNLQPVRSHLYNEEEVSRHRSLISKSFVPSTKTKVHLKTRSKS